MKKSPRRKRVSKAEWLAQSLEVLAAEGVQGVRVERLARDLGIAKAGFYWHFRDRRDLMQSLLDYWTHLRRLAAVGSTYLGRSRPT